MLVNNMQLYLIKTNHFYRQQKKLYLCSNLTILFSSLQVHNKCQCIAQTSLAHWAQPNILFLQFTHFACTAHIPSLYKALYCILLYTHQYTDYSVFLSHFILLIDINVITKNQENLQIYLYFNMNKIIFFILVEKDVT